MKRTNTILAMLFALGFVATVASAGENEANPGAGPGDPASRDHGVAAFIDENGDGFNDLAPDADGDGIPNGLDSDYVRPEDGAGKQSPQWTRMLSTQHAARFFWGPWGMFAFEGTGRAGGSSVGFGFGSNGPGYGSGLGPKGHQGGPPDRGNRR